MSTAQNDSAPASNSSQRMLGPFRLAVWRGLGVVAPPLLTIVIFFWIGNTIRLYVLEPVTWATREVLVWAVADIRQGLPLPDPLTRETQFQGETFVRLADGTFIPREVDAHVRQHLQSGQVPTTGLDVYRRYVEVRYLKPWVVIPVFLCLFVLCLYLLGKFLAIGIGRFFVAIFEKLFATLPLVRNVYSSVKQVTGLMFNEHELEYTRIVAVEFPSKGIWSVGFVTGESLLDIQAAANEPVLAVLIPYSPLPITGCTITVRKSETIDLNITVDQAFQFIVSCGVVVPPQQLAALAARRLPKTAASPGITPANSTANSTANSAANSAAALPGSGAAADRQLASESGS